MSEYEQKEFDKLMTVVRAALQNPCTGDEIEITTSGHSPHARVRIKAYVFEKFLRPTKAA